LNPANGAPVTVPTQDMVLGLYYLTKGKQSTPDMKVKGEGQTFYGPEEVIIAYNEQRVDLHAIINCRIKRPNGNYEIIKTTVGRVIFNQVVPEGYGYINSLLTKKTMRSIIMEILNRMGNAVTADFLDDVKNLGYRTAFKGGLSFKLSDVIVPDDKPQTIQAAKNKVDAIQANYNMGIITDNERYNQIIDGWKDVARGLSEQVVDSLSKDQEGFNPVYMMLDSGARGSKDQIRQLCGIRGLMNKPQKSGDKSGRVTIENPIVASLKEGLSVLEYFISTHGARKGLADTALKTADAGYLTRRLVDVAHDVIISEEDCGTLRGLEISIPRNLEGGKRMDFIVKKLLGRVAVNDIVNPETQEVITYADEELTEAKCIALHKALIFEVEIRSVLTCESKRGVCARCYGRNLSTGKIVQKGEAVGVIAAQSIGEPGTQLTLRTFHEGGVAGAGKDEAGRMIAKHDGIVEITELRYVDYIDRNKNKVKVVIGRSAELRILDPKTNIALFSANLPYGATLYYNDGNKVKQGELIAEWDAYNAVMISEVSGKVSFHNIIENVTYRVEKDEATGIEEKTIIESKLKSKSPAILLTDVDGNIEKTYDIPVGSILVVEDKKKLKSGDVLVKIPRSTIKASDITGGLPRVQELFEARNASDKATVAEIDGFVRFGAPKKMGDRIEILPSTKLKNGRKEITIESRSGEYKTYLIPATKQILAQENDFVKAGTPLSEGPITPADILAIQGPTKVQEYIVSQIQGVYQAQDVTINDKHFEVIVRQMMRKVEVMEAGDTTFLEGEIVSKIAFKEENDKINGKKVVIDAGASDTYRAGQIISARELRDENMLLKANNKKEMAVRDTVHAVARQILQSITQSALQSEGFLSAASFQQTTKVLTEAAINGKTDYLLGMKANVIIGQHLIPAGTGLPEYTSIRVANKEEYARREENLAI
ncbi:MAG: DNA-directed RNA polymerase subunit beta', partial [Bacteroidales bacterium]|nr:DNA-directed RNA polymerase subunit beta' [Bacteroidales bacterium]